MQTQSKFARLWQHLRITDKDAQRAFPLSSLQAIEAAIAEGEARHRGEVLLIVEPSLDWQQVWANMAPRERARELFAAHGIWDTEENCGVLIYVNLADHQVEIVADRGVGRVIPQEEWQALCKTMTEGFARGAFHDSVLAAIHRLNDLLHEHYPDDGSQRNQLSNRPVMI